MTKPTREQAEEAVKVLLRWAGEDTSRPGLMETPKRVVKAFDEWFCGYHDDPEAILSKSFDDVENYDEMVLLKNMRVESHCEHHMAPIIGKAHVAYIPSKKVVGISKLARLVDCYAKRLQTQETMTKQIATALEEHCKPLGVAVIIDSYHQCMTTRGVHKHETSTITSKMLGVFKEDPRTRAELMSLIKMEA